MRSGMSSSARALHIALARLVATSLGVLVMTAEVADSAEAQSSIYYSDTDADNDDFWGEDNTSSNGTTSTARTTVRWSTATVSTTSPQESTCPGGEWICRSDDNSADEDCSWECVLFTTSSTTTSKASITTSSATQTTTATATATHTTNTFTSSTSTTSPPVVYTLSPTTTTTTKTTTTTYIGYSGTTVKVAGSLKIAVSNAEAFIGDESAVEAIATVLGLFCAVPHTQVSVTMSLYSDRRLAEAPASPREITNGEAPNQNQQNRNHQQQRNRVPHLEQLQAGSTSGARHIDARNEAFKPFPTLAAAEEEEGINTEEEEEEAKEAANDSAFDRPEGEPRVLTSGSVQVDFTIEVLQSGLSKVMSYLEATTTSLVSESLIEELESRSTTLATTYEVQVWDIGVPSLSTESSSADNDDAGPDVGLIVGLSIGGALLIVCCVGGGFYWRHRIELDKRRNRRIKRKRKDKGTHNREPMNLLQAEAYGKGEQVIDIDSQYGSDSDQASHDAEGLSRQSPLPQPHGGRALAPPAGHQRQAASTPALIAAMQEAAEAADGGADWHQGPRPTTMGDPHRTRRA